jgi:alpha-L-rhamnosidase
MIDAGLTSLSEKIMPNLNSQNHHFFGDISALMIEYIAGIRVNPRLEGARSVDIAPIFPKEINYAEGYHDTLSGRLSVRWDRVGENIELSACVPEGIDCRIAAPRGYRVCGEESVRAKSGKYVFTKIN